MELNDRRGGLVRTVARTGAMAAHNKLTRHGRGRDASRSCASARTPDETRKLWSALPALAASAALGGPRPGATVLAVTTAPGGGVFPVVAVQRYGQGRSMVFAGEASWRWKMMVASSDRTYEFFWRQAARWLSSPAPDPVAISRAGRARARRRHLGRRRGARRRVRAGRRRDGRRHADGSRAARRRPSSCATPIPPAAATPRRSRPTSPASIASTPKRGAGRRRSAPPIGGCTSAARIGNSRIRGSTKDSCAASRATPAAATSAPPRPPRVPAWLEATVPQNAAPERRDLWHEPWAFALVVVLLSAEWILRRRWGLR